MSSQHMLALLQEQEAIAKRSLEICALLRSQCHHALPSAGAAAARPDGAGAGLQEPLLGGQRGAEAGAAPAPWRRQASEGARWLRQISEGWNRQLSSGSRGMPQHGFSNPEVTRQEVKKHLESVGPSFMVESDYYRSDGCCSTMAKHNMFKTISFVAIVLNMIWVGIDVDYNQATFLCDAPIGFQICESAFCLFFVFEFAVRFLSFSCKRDCLKDVGFIVDGFLVAFMVWDAWILSFIHVLATKSEDYSTPNASALRVLRLLRLTRLARMARVVRNVPQFSILIKGVGMALWSVFSMLGLLVLIIYVFAILFTELFRDSPDADEAGFGTVVQSMNSLLLNGIFAEQREVLQHLLTDGLAYYILMVVFLVLATMAVLNMLIGILSELIGGVAELERECIRLEQVKESLRSILPDLDTEHTGTITLSEFQKILKVPKAVAVLSELDVDVIALVDFADHIFQGRHEISFGEMMSTVMKFRGSQQVTMTDMMDTREFLAREIRHSFRKMTAGQDQRSSVAACPAPSPAS